VAAVLALVSSVLWGTADFAGGRLSRRLPSLVVVGCSQAVALVGVLVTVLALGERADPGGWVAWSIVAGLSGASGLACFYRALAMGTMGVVSPVAALGVAVPVVAGVLTGERPSTVQVAGIVVAMAGAVAASGPELSGSAVAGPKGRASVALAVVSGALFGLCQLAIARGARSSGLLTLLGMRATSIVLFAIVLVAGGLGVRGLKAGRALAGLLAWRDLPMLAAIGLSDVGANLLFAIASTKGLVSIVAVLGSLYPVATVLLARFVLGERLLRLQIGGVATTLAGVALLSMG
jgi:drug/metabolite transporter (DMT)-like permease